MRLKKMFKMALNIQWKRKISNDNLFGNIPKPSLMIANRWLRMAGQLQDATTFHGISVTFWDSQRGRKGPSRPLYLTFIDIHAKETHQPPKCWLGPNSYAWSWCVELWGGVRIAWTKKQPLVPTIQSGIHIERSWDGVMQLILCDFMFM